eukprot:TRINITY_DN4938_c0_g1_i6.p1 TRINITY_DN4938_c0_g1~~TRINITY_DN4938_c0_g1_i6.p1  ORF type:complete len:234 (+),score=43.16 TRINITY_DN4938_c0_g1_i6:67-768(+)
MRVVCAACGQKFPIRERDSHVCSLATTRTSPLGGHRAGLQACNAHDEDAASAGRRKESPSRHGPCGTGAATGNVNVTPPPNSPARHAHPPPARLATSFAKRVGSSLAKLVRRKNAKDGQMSPRASPASPSSSLFGSSLSAGTAENAVVYSCEDLLCCGSFADRDASPHTLAAPPVAGDAHDAGSLVSPTPANGRGAEVPGAFWNADDEPVTPTTRFVEHQLGVTHMRLPPSLP